MSALNPTMRVGDQIAYRSIAEKTVFEALRVTDGAEVPIARISDENDTHRVTATDTGFAIINRQNPQERPAAAPPSPRQVLATADSHR